jgi:hydrogenase maturation factor
MSSAVPGRILEARVGDYVLVHVGFATKLVPEEEALRAWVQQAASKPN